MDLNKQYDAPPIDPMDAEQNKVMAVLAYILFFIPMLAAPQSRFAMYHANQGLILLIVAVANMVLSIILALIPIIGWLISIALSIGIFVLWIMGIINSATGQAKPLPLIGNFSILTIP